MNSEDAVKGKSDRKARERDYGEGQTGRNREDKIKPGRRGDSGTGYKAWAKHGSAVRKGIPHNHADLPRLVPTEATGICIPIGNSELLLAAVHKSPGHAWSDADISEVLNFRRKSLLAGDLNVKHPVLNSVVLNPSREKLLNLVMIFQRHNVPLTTFLPVFVMCSILWYTTMSDCQ
jgi:hypothetical protein